MLSFTRAALLAACLASACHATPEIVPLNIVAVLQEPYVWSETHHGETTWGGAIIDLLSLLFDTIEATYNFRYEPTYYPSPDDSYGAPVPGGGWTGAIQELITSRANLSAAALTITAQRASVVAFSLPFTSSGKMVLVTTHHEAESPWMWTAPFQPWTWAIVAAITVCCAAALFVIDLFSPFGALNLIYDSHDPEHEFRERQRYSLANSMFYTSSTILEKECEMPMAPSTRAVIIALFACTLFIHSAYEAGLTSLEVIAAADTGVSSFVDIQQGNKSFGVLANSSDETFFLYNPVYQLRRMSKTMVRYHSLDDAVEALEHGDISAIVGRRQLLQYYASEQPCHLKLVGQPLNVEFFGFAMQLGAVGSDLQLQLNASLVAAIESGDLQRIMTGALSLGTACDPVKAITHESVDKTLLDPRSHQLPDFAGIFLVYAALFGFSVSLLFLELAAHSQRASGNVWWKHIIFFFGVDVDAKLDAHEPHDEMPDKQASDAQHTPTPLPASAALSSARNTNAAASTRSMRVAQQQQLASNLPPSNLPQQDGVEMTQLNPLRNPPDVALHAP